MNSFIKAILCGLLGTLVVTLPGFVYGISGEADDEPVDSAVDINAIVNEVPPGQISPNQPGDTDWPYYNRTLEGRRFSELNQINEQNVASLEEACRVRVDGPGPLSSGPILVNGVIYITTGRAVTALDATNCDVVWKSIYAAEGRQVYAGNRGAVYHNGMIFRGTPDARLVAYDANTGAEKWRTKVGDPDVGEYVSSAPTAWKDKVFVGLAGSEWGIRGRVMAFDAASGKQLWSFNTIPQKGEFGNDTWAGDSWKLGGGGTWSSYTIDPETGELFVPVANPSPDYNPAVREGDNLFTNSILVLDAETGKRNWHFQTIKNDSHDYGISPPAVLIERDGKPVVAQGSKDGFVYLVDREKQELVWKTAVTTILNHQVRPTVEGVLACPGASGGVEYNSPAYDPIQNQLVVGAVDWCTRFFLAPELKYDRGLLYLGGTNNLEGAGAGWVTALDAHSGNINWQFKAPVPVVSGIMPTGGGVTFVGDIAGNLYAFRSEDGEILATWNTGGALAGGIITYQRGGRQYVALTSGNISRLPFAGAGGLPSIIIYQLPDELVATGSQATVQPGNTSRGQVLYTNICASCHGGNGEGLEGADLRGIAQRYNYQQTVELIRNPPQTMPRLYPAVLNAQDVADLAAYIRNF